MKYMRNSMAYTQTFSRHRLRLVGRTDGGLHPAFYSSPNGDIAATSQILRPLCASRAHKCE